MAVDMKPCPFCGGVHVEIVNQGSRPDDPHVVQCDDFDASVSGMSADEAMTAWNRRADRTCRVESSHEVEDDGSYSYFEYELTCGHEIAWGYQLPPSYCPECGRRVLYDSDDYI